MILGLTGGIASGKTTVADLLAEQGIDIFDADQVARDIVKPGEPTLSEIIKHFGQEVLSADGTLNRQALRKIIFDASDERIWLENLTHPRIRQRMQESAANSTAQHCCLVIPLLVNRQAYPMIEKVIVVDVDENIQIERLMARDHIDETAAKKILCAQISRQSRLKLADFVITNNNGPESLTKQVEKLADSHFEGSL